MLFRSPCNLESGSGHPCPPPRPSRLGRMITAPLLIPPPCIPSLPAVSREHNHSSTDSSLQPTQTRDRTHAGTSEARLHAHIPFPSRFQSPSPGSRAEGRSREERKKDRQCGLPYWASSGGRENYCHLAPIPHPSGRERVLPIGGNGGWAGCQIGRAHV